MYLQSSVLKDGRRKSVTLLRLDRLDEYLKEHGEQALDDLQQRIDCGEFEHLLAKAQSKADAGHKPFPEACDALLKTAFFIAPLNYGHLYLNAVFKEEVNLQACLSVWRHRYCPGPSCPPPLPCVILWRP